MGNDGLCTLQRGMGIDQGEAPQGRNTREQYVSRFLALKFSMSVYLPALDRGQSKEGPPPRLALESQGKTFF